MVVEGLKPSSAYIFQVKDVIMYLLSYNLKQKKKI